MSLIQGYLVKNKIKPLSKEEIYDLIGKIRRGCKASQDKLIIHNLPYVLRLTQRHVNSCTAVMAFDDLFQEGVKGLMRAIKTFDVARGLAFTTYADPWIKQHIERFIDDNYGPVRTPVYLNTLKNKYNRLKNVDNPKADDFYLRLVANNKGKTIETLRHAITNTPSEFHIDGCEDPFDLEDLIDENAIDIKRLDAKVMLEMLDDKERLLIERRMMGLTLDKIGKEIGLSRERVRQLEEMALFKLKAMVGNVRDNKVFETRDMLVKSFQQAEVEIKKKVESLDIANRIYGTCRECMESAMELPENVNKRQIKVPSWIYGQCDVCFKVKAVTSVKDYQSPVFEVMEVVND